ncbi:MAG: UDP-N-acetylglucosamine--N-acetylmuramyl-(pentapeptide) pyrophosphoryl-undecaprenol N-acetylglucosamine transferase [Caldilineaceae bacterium]|nr:UDP-N-acetylglucosamine--N-acetylmuramyl-(pentapeptide) pyrophosphoryl-undecaprenol N-acetylglucosamine transferase [Caldilineaceae bacterium]
MYPALAVADHLRAANRPAVAAQRQPVGVQPAVAALAQRAQPAAVVHPAAEAVEVGTVEVEVASANDLLWIGSKGGMEQALVERAHIAYRGIDTGKINGLRPWQAVRNIGRMARGVMQAVKLIDAFRPHVCLVTGGYVCTPVVAACRWRGIPVMIYLPDMAPGWAIRTLSYLAQRVAITLPGAAEHFGGLYPQGKAVVTGYPVRAELVTAAQDRHQARRHLAQALECPLDGNLPLLLVWGGSQGARSINQATWAALADLTQHAQILHAVGERDWPLYADEFKPHVDELPPALRANYCPLPYLHEEMTLALAAADLTVARAGASTLGEFPVAKLPSILAPLPFAGVNQMRNAAELVDRGAAVVLADEQLKDKLTETVLMLLTDEPKRLHMEEVLAQMAQSEAAANIAHELEKLVG